MNIKQTNQIRDPRTSKAMETPEAMESTNAFMEDIQSVMGQSKDLVPNGTYRTLAPIMQLYAKKLWVGGHVANEEALLNDVCAMHPQIERVELKGYLAAHMASWEPERTATLQKFYDNALEDKDRIHEHIDYTYDALADKLRGMVSKTMDTLATGDAVSPRHLKSISSTLKEMREVQREIRGLQSGKAPATHNHLHISNEQTKAFQKQSEDMKAFLKGARVSEVIDVEDTLNEEQRGQSESKYSQTA
jgi:hypothetical protein